MPNIYKKRDVSNGSPDITVGHDPANPSLGMMTRAYKGVSKGWHEMSVVQKRGCVDKMDEMKKVGEKKEASRLRSQKWRSNKKAVGVGVSLTQKTQDEQFEMMTKWESSIAASKRDASTGTVVLNNGEHGYLSLPVRQGMTQPTNQGTNNSNSATPSEYLLSMAMKQLKEAGEERKRRDEMDAEDRKRKDEMDAEARKRKDEMDAEDRRRTQNLAAAAAKADADDRRHDKELAAERERAAAERERAAAAERMHGQDLAAEQSKLTQEILLAAISSNNGNGPNEGAVPPPATPNRPPARPILQTPNDASTASDARTQMTVERLGEEQRRRGDETNRKLGEIHTLLLAGGNGNTNLAEQFGAVARFDIIENVWDLMLNKPGFAKEKDDIIETSNDPRNLRVILCGSTETAMEMVQSAMLGRDYSPAAMLGGDHSPALNTSNSVLAIGTPADVHCFITVEGISGEDTHELLESLEGNARLWGFSKTCSVDVEKNSGESIIIPVTTGGDVFRDSNILTPLLKLIGKIAPSLGGVKQITLSGDEKMEKGEHVPKPFPVCVKDFCNDFPDGVILNIHKCYLTRIQAQQFGEKTPTSMTLKFEHSILPRDDDGKNTFLEAIAVRKDDIRMIFHGNSPEVGTDEYKSEDRREAGLKWLLKMAAKENGLKIGHLHLDFVTFGRNELIAYKDLNLVLLFKLPAPDFLKVHGVKGFFSVIHNEIPKWQPAVTRTGNPCKRCSKAKYCHTHNSHNSRADEIIGNLDKKMV